MRKANCKLFFSSRYSSIPRECQEFTRLEPQTSSLRSASVNYRQENNCRWGKFLQPTSVEWKLRKFVQRLKYD